MSLPVLEHPYTAKFRGQGSQAVGWCEDVLGVLMVEGQQHPEPGFWASHHFLLHTEAGIITCPSYQPANFAGTKHWGPGP